MPEANALLDAQRRLFAASTGALARAPRPDDVLSAWAEIARAQREAAREISRLSWEAALAGRAPSMEQAFDAYLGAQARALRPLLWAPWFADLAGEWAASGASLRRAIEDAQAETLHALGLVTRRDAEEIGRRLLDLERAEHETARALKELGRSRAAEARAR